MKFELPKLGKEPVCEKLAWKPITEEDKVALSRIKLSMSGLSLMNKNPSIGFEAANHYYFSRFGICEKVVNCDYLLEKYGK